MKVVRLVHSKSVKGSRAHLGTAGKISTTFRPERMESARRIFGRAFFENEIDAFGLRRPESKMRFVLTDQLRADGITSLYRARSVRRDASVTFQGSFSFHPQDRQQTCGQVSCKQPWKTEVPRVCSALAMLSREVLPSSFVLCSVRSLR